MNEPAVQTLLTANDVFVRIVQAIKGEVIRELKDSGLGADLNARLNDLERSVDPASIKYLSTRLDDLEASFGTRITDLEDIDDRPGRWTEEKIKDVIDDKLEDYDPTDYIGFDREVSRIIDARDDDDLEDKIREFINSNVSVDISVSR
jgi:hypothetical protein